MRLRENGLSADDSACCLVSCTQVLSPSWMVSFSLIASRRDDQTLARAWVLYYTTSAVVVVVAAGSFTHTLIFSLSLDFHFFVCVSFVFLYTYENGVTQFGGWRFSHNPDSRESSDFLFVSSSWVSGWKWDAGNITLFPCVVAIAIPPVGWQCLKWAPVGWAPTLQAARPATVYTLDTHWRLLMKTCELRGRWWLLLLGSSWTLLSFASCKDRRNDDRVTMFITCRPWLDAIPNWAE